MSTLLQIYSNDLVKEDEMDKVYNMLVEEECIQGFDVYLSTYLLLLAMASQLW
jgi:hypothetical protein